MRVTISPRAEKELKRIQKIDQFAIARKVRTIQTGKPVDKKKLAGFKDVYRARVGDYRIIYRKTQSELYVVTIGHRKDIYDLVKNIFR